MKKKQVQRTILELSRPVGTAAGWWDGDDSGEIARRMRELDEFSSTCLKTPPPSYDPIFTPLFTAIGLTGSITIGATTITTAAIASAIATTALSIGLQILMTPKPPKPDDGKVPITQAVPYRIWAVGRCRLSGALVLWEAKGKRLFAVHAVAGHRIKSYNRYWLHDDEVTDHINGSTGQLTYSGSPYEDNVWIWTRNGLATETPYSQIVTYLGAEGIWTNSHRGDGTASMAMQADQTKAEAQASRFPYGAPRLSAEGDWAYIWDYRDSAQDPEDDSTWTWTRNSALILCWHLCFNPYGERRDYRKAILPVLDMWVEEADICDEAIATAAGGSFPRYQCSGWDTTEHDPKVGTNAILSTCDGWMCYRGDGAILLTVGKFRESRVATLSDQDISGYQIQHDVLPQDECNRLVPKFNYPDTDYTESDTDFWEDETAQAVIGRVLSKEGDYRWCTNWRQARMLGKRDWLRIQQKVRGSLNVRFSGINGIYARWIRLDTPFGMPRFDGILIENRHAVLNIQQGGFTMDFIKQPDAIDAWTPATDEGAQPPVPSAPNPAGLDAPTLYSVAPKATASGSVYLVVKVVDPDDTSLGLALRYRLSAVGSGSPGDWSANQKFENFTPSGGYVTVTTATVPGDVTLDVQASWYTSKGKYSDWSTTGIVFTTADPTAPGLVTGLTVSTGVGVANFGWTAPNSSNYAGAKIYWNTTNNFATASFLGPVEYGSPNISDSASRSLTAGTRYAWITSVNFSGVESGPVATGTFTVS